MGERRCRVWRQVKVSGNLGSRPLLDFGEPQGLLPPRAERCERPRDGIRLDVAFGILEHGGIVGFGTHGAFSSLPTRSAAVAHRGQEVAPEVVARSVSVADRLEHSCKGVGNHVVDLRRRAQHPLGGRLGRPTMALVQLAEGLTVPATGPIDELTIGGRERMMTPPHDPSLPRGRSGDTTDDAARHRVAPVPSHFPAEIRRPYRP